MAQPTKDDAPKPEGMRPTPGVSPGQLTTRPSMVGPFQTPDTKPAEPVLYEDTDPVYLVRLYGAATSANEMRAAAAEAGRVAYEQGSQLVASQQEPIYDSGTAAPPTEQPSSTRPQTMPARPGDPAHR